jgi:hypothetical protein
MKTMEERRQRLQQLEAELATEGSAVAEPKEDGWEDSGDVLSRIRREHSEGRGSTALGRSISRRVQFRDPDDSGPKAA